MNLRLDQGAIAAPPCALALAYTVLLPRRLRHQLGKIDTSIIGLKFKTRSSGRDNIYCSPRTVNSVVTSELDRLGQHLVPVLGWYHSPGPPTPPQNRLPFFDCWWAYSVNHAAGKQLREVHCAY
jgi:hypothetical protein